MSRRRVLAVVALAAVPFALLVWRFDFLCDDAYISFRYARHLVEGRGLTFNPGESPPVEGFSNLMWVLWMALVSRLGAPMEVASRVSSFACGLALLALFIRFLARRGEFPARSVVAGALFLAVLPPIALWSTSGLETMPFALACFATFERLCGDRERPHGVAAGLCAAAAALLRADGVLWAAIVIAAAGVGWARSRSPVLRRAILVTAAILAVTVAANFDWRNEYFGQWLPNTAYVKVGLSAMRLERGANYLAGLALAVPPLAYVPIVVFARRGRAPLLALQAGVVVGAGALYAAYVGGDFMPMGRMVTAAMPFVALLFAIAAARIERAGPRAAFTWGSLALLVLADAGAPFVPHSVLQVFHHRWNVTEAPTEIEVWNTMRSHAAEWRTLGRALSLNTKPGESIVLGNVGAIGFETELLIYDEFGIVTPEVARRDAAPVRASAGHDRRVPPAFFLRYHPTYVNAVLVPPDSPADAGLPSDWELQAPGVRLAVERRSLPVDEFGPGVELRLLRPH